MGQQTRADQNRQTFAINLSETPLLSTTLKGGRGRLS